ncbi:hypothetical protein GCM10010277_23680 [Streptomyces longisporoflavus]|uniref:hypothetical protein n=1 Tax=Streptomyces longisporoflavus TaxID=28044 RepID=UPI00167D508F|nr:hypothetical protein [Streptomyces longisporoflavus]GGV37257.1 hypothetical protein GCM10010277_23680 [Streptomyces longisporoflavus]
MGRHRRPAGPAPGPTLEARRKLTAGLAGASALIATVLALTIDPAAPPAPDRTPAEAPAAPRAAP